mmetsp:Transcript_56316/g.92541  ORF Transcript_56316/g.92541 Transcript_56316/m.92541 type:complete len:244 (+) Transcript_56316:553-1284(+)
MRHPLPLGPALDDVLGAAVDHDDLPVRVVREVHNAPLLRVDLPLRRHDALVLLGQRFWGVTGGVQLVDRDAVGLVRGAAHETDDQCAAIPHVLVLLDPGPGFGDRDLQSMRGADELQERERSGGQVLDDHGLGDVGGGVEVLMELVGAGHVLQDVGQPLVQGHEVHELVGQGQAGGLPGDGEVLCVLEGVLELAQVHAAVFGDLWGGHHGHASACPHTHGVLLALLLVLQQRHLLPANIFHDH